MARRSSRIISSIIESPPICNLCETGVGVHSRCLECQENLCENCRRVHTKGKATKNHRIVHIYGSREVDVAPYTKFVKCTEHEHCDVIMYCKNCECLVCSHCIAGPHAGHFFEQIDSTYNTKVEELANRFDNIENHLLKEICIQLKKVQFKKRHKKSETEFLKERIIQLTEVQKKALEKRRDQLIQELDNHFSTTEKTLDKTESDLTQVKTSLQECKQIIQKSLLSFERVGVIRTANSTNRKMATIDTSQTIPIIESPSFEKTDLDMTTCLGTVTFALNSNGGDSITETTNGVKVETSVVGVLETEFRFISTVCQVNGGYCWVGCSSDDSIMLVHCGDDLQEISRTAITADNIAHLTSDTLLVSCPDDHIIRQISALSGESETFLDVSPLFPTGVHIKGNDILISMVEGHRYSFKVDSQRKVVRYSSDKNIKSEYQFAGTKRLFTYPYRLCENINTDVCVVDKSGAFTGRLVVIDQSGQLKFTYTGTTTVEQKPTFDPRDVVCDSVGRIIVSDCGNHIVHILDQDGDIVCHVNTLKHGIKFPWSLSLDSYVNVWMGCKAEPGKSDIAKLFVVEAIIEQE